MKCVSKGIVKSVSLRIKYNEVCVSLGIKYGEECVSIGTE